jgi:hypothetical protein
MLGLSVQQPRHGDAIDAERLTPRVVADDGLRPRVFVELPILR